MSDSPSMTRGTGIDSDALELIERRLSEKIEADVKSRLFRTYGAVASAVLAVVGLIGWGTVWSIEEHIKTVFATQVSAQYIDQMNSIKAQISLADAARQTAVKQLSDVNERIASAEWRLANVQAFSDKMDRLDVQAKDVASSIADRKTTLDAMVKLLPDLKNLADRLSQLAAASASPESTAIAASASSIANNLSGLTTAIADSKSNATVFFQYNSMTSDTAKALSDLISANRFRFPGLDQENMPADGLSQVRYYYQDDLDSANRLATAANAAVSSLHIKDALPVTVKSYVDWPRAKPKSGTLELWIGLPTIPSP